MVGFLRFPVHIDSILPLIPAQNATWAEMVIASLFLLVPLFIGKGSRAHRRHGVRGSL